MAIDVALNCADSASVSLPHADETIGDHGHLTPLHCAVFHNDAEKVLELLDGGVESTATNYKGRSALHYAAEKAYTAIIALLLAYGANINATDCDGWTALHHAAINDHSHTVSQLLAHGADLEAKTTSCDRTAWLLAVEQGHIATLSHLRSHGADISAKAAHESALEIAVSSGKTTTVVYLLDSGAVADIKGKESSTALLSAAWKGDTAMVAHMVAHGVDVNSSRVHDRRTALHVAAANGRSDTVSFLVTHGANMNAKAKYGYTALHDAVHNADMVLQLLASGAPVNARSCVGETALYLAAFFGHQLSVSHLLDYRAQMNRKGAFNTALHVAAMRGHGAIVSQLVARGAAVNIVNGSGQSALHYAAEQACGVADLLAHGAHTHIVDHYGLTALDLAASKGHADEMSLLLAYGAEINEVGGHDMQSALHRASYPGNRASLKVLLEYGADVNVLDEDGREPLYFAMRTAEAAEVLLENGANTAHRDRFNNTALDRAVGLERMDVVARLLSAGADIHTTYIE